MPNDITVLGIGNTIYSDEGIGVHLLTHVEKALKDFSNVTIIEGATDGMRLLGPIEETNHLIILDAINAGKEPGEVIVLEREEIPAYYGIKMSIHQIGFQEVLGAAQLLEKLPEHMIMFGVQPEVLDFGVGISDSVQKQIPTLVDLVKKKVEEWGE